MTRQGDDSLMVLAQESGRRRLYSSGDARFVGFAYLVGAYPYVPGEGWVSKRNRSRFLNDTVSHIFGVLCLVFESSSRPFYRSMDSDEIFHGASSSFM